MQSCCPEPGGSSRFARCRCLDRRSTKGRAVRIKTVDATPGERSLEEFDGLSFRFGQGGGVPKPSVLGNLTLAVIASIDILSTNASINDGMGELAVLEDRLLGFLSSGRRDSGPFDEFDTKEVVVFATGLVDVSAIAVTQKLGFLSAKKGRDIVIEVGDPEAGGAIITIVPHFAFTSSGFEKSKDATPLAHHLLAAVSENRGFQPEWQQIPGGLAVEF
jgi:hypothetical protein